MSLSDAQCSSQPQALNDEALRAAIERDSSQTCLELAAHFQELNICCKKALKAQKQLDQTADEENEPPWIGVVVDVLLSLLSNSSHHVHRLIISVFPLLCPFITKEALQVVLDVINPQNPSQEEMEIESGEENEEIEFVSESSSDEEVSNTDKVDEEFREKVKSALGSAAEPDGSDV
ncbi:myb-binding protein 1A-like, partial [Stegodyphus dumicola]|uniref:myb-binding protein 1A-like n=1 Tax=Stegodyphus dumicola TaxID=202533 RepID=UPI0015A809B3